MFELGCSVWLKMHFIYCTIIKINETKDLQPYVKLDSGLK